MKDNKIFTTYSSREAAELWRLSENTVTQWCNRGRFEEWEARKSAKVWIVTREGMVRLTGREPGGNAEGD
ncbi:helix-turn-helix domain-containing protein [Paenibacillus sp. JDR-2]|uniref:helix-turn-helix domain-containing protein n=1 Tax=Paenibacillus sp. (strain JDR-2) TaxID=324057 RepID=UPI0005A0CE7F|nr:helix-turn-helix domain-containing protein [Paenibacillus sp. JDR-2]